MGLIEQTRARPAGRERAGRAGSRGRRPSVAPTWSPARSRSRSASTASGSRSRCARPFPARTPSWRSASCSARAIVGPDQVARISECRSSEGDGGVADVLLRPGAQPADGWQRDFYATSSCGICGKQSIEAVRAAAALVPDGPQVATRHAVRSARTRCARASGCSTAPAACTPRPCSPPAGDLIAVREDVGRHNAVDKLVGRAAMDGLLPLHDHVLMVSGRVSFEIVQKALAAGFPVVAAVSAPSSLAVRLASESNMTLVGFLRADAFNVYAGAERVRAAGSARSAGLHG